MKFLASKISIQSFTNVRARGFWTIVSEDLRPPLVFVVQSLCWEFEKLMSLSQKYCNLTINVRKLHGYMSHWLLLFFMRIATVIVIIMVVYPTGFQVGSLVITTLNICSLSSLRYYIFLLYCVIFSFLLYRSFLFFSFMGLMAK